MVEPSREPYPEDIDGSEGPPPPRSRAIRWLAWTVVVAFIGSVAVGFGAFAYGGSSRSVPDAGQLEEPRWELPNGVTVPSLVDASEIWRLAGRPINDRLDPMAGGLAVGDLDRDGDLDLVVAHGAVEVYRWDGDRFLEPLTMSGAAMGVTVFDVDADGWLDLLVARSGDTDLLIWGGTWVGDGADPREVTPLAGTSPTAALLAAELNGDGRIDVVRLGRGTDRGVPDIVWTANPDSPRTFTETALGPEARISLSGALADVDGDGLVDVWVTRDVGWDTGGDSVYSRQGDPQGAWVDIAGQIGADLEIDAMGITLADLDGDTTIDAYVSDLGDNEVLVGHDDVFTAIDGTGAARIRPPGASTDVISSSWASGATDVNLDGRLDLIVVNGGFAQGGMRNKIAGTSIAVDDPPAILVGLGEGRFVDVWPSLGLPDGGSTRGLTIADIDNDGDDDYITLAADGALRAFENTTSGRSVTVQPAPGCDPTGAIVSVRTGDQTYTTLFRALSFGGSHSPAVIAGIGDIPEVTVGWLNGMVTDVEVPAGTGRLDLMASC